MQKRILNVIILISILAGSTGYGFSQGKIIDQVIAVVGNKAILLSDIENQYYQFKLQNLESHGDVKCDILEEMLYQKLLLNQAELDSIEVTVKEVDNALDNRIKYFISQIGSQEKLEAYFNKSLLEMKAQFREKIKEQMLTQKMQSKISDEIKITPSEVRTFFKSLPEDSLPVLNVEYEIEQIVKYPPVSEKEKIAVREKLNGLRDRVLKGDKFSTLAVLYSEDPGSAKKGGELGFVGRADLVPEFAAVAFNLKEGEVSRIVETEFGYHIIQFIEKKGELINVRHILLSPKVSSADEMKAKYFLDSISTMLKTDTISFEKAATLYSEDVSSKNNNGIEVNPATGTAKFEATQVDPVEFEAIKDLKPGQYSKPFVTKDAKGKSIYKIVKLKSKSKKHKANLTDDYQQIQDMALAQSKQTAINQWIEKKLETTYVHIDDSYKRCSFKIKGWMK